MCARTRSRTRWVVRDSRDSRDSRNNPRRVSIELAVIQRTIALSQLFLPQCPTAEQILLKTDSGGGGGLSEPFTPPPPALAYDGRALQTPHPRQSLWNAGRVSDFFFFFRRSGQENTRYVSRRTEKREYPLLRFSFVSSCTALTCLPLGRRIDLSRKIHGPFSPYSRPYSPPRSSLRYFHVSLSFTSGSPLSMTRIRDTKHPVGAIVSVTPPFIRQRVRLSRSLRAR